MATLNIPNTFVNATIASATEVNANFSAVKTFAETNVVQTDGSVKAGTVAIQDGAVTEAKLAPGILTSVSPPGAVTAYAGAAAPTGWALCDGTEILKTNPTYAAVFAVIGIAFGETNGSGGTGTTHFRLPNLKGRIPVGLDSTQTEFDVRGETGGHKALASHNHDMGLHTHAINHDHGSVSTTSDSHSHTLDVEATPSTGHTHSGTTGDYVAGEPSGGTGAGVLSGVVNSDSHTHSVDLPNFVGVSSTPSSNTTGSTGTGNAGNLQPYLVLNYIIKL